MIVYRLSSEKYARRLTASGAPNRWNREGQFVLYTGSSRALCSLEQLVHMSGIIPITKYKMMVIEIDDEVATIEEVKLSQLSKDWRKISQYHIHQRIGSEWYEATSSLLLKVPSAIIPQESNYILNTAHSAFPQHVRIHRIEDYFWDGRLFS